MTISVRLVLPFAVVCALGASGPAARAQGTPEQRAACAPDAIKLCPDTIPDVAATTACMHAHESELSPRCHAVFDAATVPQHHSAREAPDADRDDGYGPRQYLYRTPDGATAQTPRGRYRGPEDSEDDGADVDHARAEIGRLCDEGELDAGACDTTQRSLGGHPDR